MTMGVGRSIAIRPMTRIEFYSFMFQSKRLGDAIDNFISQHEIPIIDHNGVTYLEYTRLSEVTGGITPPDSRIVIRGDIYVDIQHLPRICKDYWRSKIEDESQQEVVRCDQEFSELVEKIDAISF